MTTVATRVRRISDLEGFDLIVTNGGQPVDVDENGILGPYNYSKMAKSSWRVSQWLSDRFETTYPGHTCIVLKGDGEHAAANTLLSNIRKSYEDGE